jgi:hypothetical protein
MQNVEWWAAKLYLRRVLVIALFSLLAFCTACNRQTGYLHGPKDFNTLDKKAVARVQNMPLGKSEVLNSIGSEYIDEESVLLDPCDYEVAKVIRRDLGKIAGDYPEEIHVICRTSFKDGPELQFRWVFDSDLSRIEGFKFGIDPSEYD